MIILCQYYNYTEFLVWCDPGVQYADSHKQLPK